jgi:tRNA-splicing ligase RtcB (3'-phosphate/5'-hydroxy nucleic acid ligase)
VDVIRRKEQLPIKVWADEVGAQTLEQAHHLASLPFAVRHVALMPDTHVGYGMPIGGVLATRGVVIPNAVGVDIGCGMAAARFRDFRASALSRDDLKTLLAGIYRVIPVGFAHHKQRQHLEWDTTDAPVATAEQDRAAFQVGTLGGGNHFIEIQRDDTGRVWVMVHSGSRNVGKRVADHYNGVARALQRRLGSAIPDAWHLAHLPIDSEEGQAYLADMRACVAFARTSRARMLDAVEALVGPADERLDVAHNYAADEEHFGERVVVHRKGATRAYAGEVGIVPGSQGTRSFIVRGRGHAESFMSCAHGAGRRMGRKEAGRRLDLAHEKAALDAQGILHAVKRPGDLDEAPGAYKDIDAVMASQADLVDPVVELRPLAVVKG